MVRDIDVPKLIREELRIPLAFYEDTTRIDDPNIRRIVEYREFVGRQLMQMYEGILGDYGEKLAVEGKRVQPWDTESILYFDDFVSEGDYLKKKLQEAVLVAGEGEKNHIAEFYFTPSGVTESLYELMIAKELVPIAIEGGYLLQGEEAENATKLLPPSADTLSSVFLKKLQVQQKIASQYFKEQFDVEKRRRLWNFFETGFCVSKGIVRSGVNDTFTHADLLELANEVTDGAHIKNDLDEYFAALLEKREIGKNDVPQFLKKKLRTRLDDTSRPVERETERNPRRDITHSYLMNRIKLYLEI